MLSKLMSVQASNVNYEKQDQEAVNKINEMLISFTAYRSCFSDLNNFSFPTYDFLSVNKNIHSAMKCCVSDALTRSLPSVLIKHTG